MCCFCKEILEIDNSGFEVEDDMKEKHATWNYRLKGKHMLWIKQRRCDRILKTDAQIGCETLIIAMVYFQLP